MFRRRNKKTIKKLEPHAQVHTPYEEENQQASQAVGNLQQQSQYDNPILNPSGRRQYIVLKF